MNEMNDDRIRELLKQNLNPATSELQRDLWPKMLQRLQQRSTAVPWFDWALLAALLLWLVLAPRTIPVLLYHL
jgi:hypothetical protein